MINNQTIAQKLNLIIDALIDVADDMSLSPTLSIVGETLTTVAENLSHITDSLENE